MPPQRRKIVPPTTTSKARKKVAGSSRKQEVDPTSPTVERDALVENEPLFSSEPLLGDEAGHEGRAEADDDTDGKPDTADDAETSEITESASADTAVTADKPRLDKPATAEKATTAEKAAAGQTRNGVFVDPAYSATGDGSRTRWTATIVVGVVAVALVAFAIVAALKPGTAVDNSAWVDQGESSEVTRQATEGLAALYRYNYETIDDDLANARAFMSPSMQADTDKFLDAIKSNARQSQTATDVDVMDIGLTRLESDKAELLANLNVSSTRAGVAYGNAMFPIVVNMEKIDGTWVVSATESK